MSAVTNNLSVIAAAVHDRRKSMGVTQQDVADLCGVQRQTIGRLEAGDPTIALGTLAAVTDALGLDIDIVPRRRATE